MASVGVGVDASSIVGDVTSALDPGSSPAASPTDPGSTPQASSGGSGDTASTTGDSTTPATTPSTTTTTTTNDPTTTDTSQQTTSTTTTSTHGTDTTTSTSTKTVSASPTSTTTTTAVTHTSTSSSSSAPSASPSHTASTITSTSTSTQTPTAASSDTSSSTSSAPQSNAFMPMSSSSSITTFSLGEHSILTTTTLVTTNADGVVTTMTSVFPTLAPYAPSSSSTPSTRTAIIGGTTAGAIVLIIAVCVAVFVRKSRSRKKWDLLEFMRNKHRAQRSRADLLAGEGFDDDDDPFSASMPPSAVGPMMRGPSPGVAYAAGGLGYSGHYHDRSGSPSPSIPASGHGSSTGILMRPRASESGSVFHESVWPPPGKESRFVDPILGSGSHVDLSGIVDDIMGSGDRSSEGHGSMFGGGGDGGATAHTRTPSAGTVSAGGHTRDHSGSPLLGAMPLRSSPLASRDASMASGAVGATPRPPTPSTPTIAGSRVAASGRITPVSSSRSATPNWLSRSPAR